MGQVIQVNGDYNIKTKPTGTITLDTGVATGKVVVTGNLEVKGHVLSVASEDLTIKDNIIVLNNGETGAGVTLVNSGLLIDRGTLAGAAMLFNEPAGAWEFVHEYGDSSLSYTFADSKIKVKTILTDAGTDGGDLTLIATGTGKVKVSGTTDYEQQVLDYSKLDNLLTIQFISGSGTTVTITTETPHNLVSGDLVDVFCPTLPDFNEYTSIAVTRVSEYVFTYSGNLNLPEQSISGYVRKNPVKSDDSIPNMKAVSEYTKSVVTSSISKLNVSFNQIGDYGTKVTVNGSQFGGPNSKILFTVDNSTRATINNSGLTVDSINIFGNTISSSSSTRIKIDSVLTIKNVASDPSVESGHVSLYSKNANGQGGTGLYFVNTAGTTDELVSRSKAFLYSLIF